MSLDKNYLRELARFIDSKLPDNYGFIMLTFPFGDDPNSRVTYTSNARREDAINAMKEFIIRAGGEEEWMETLAMIHIQNPYPRSVIELGMVHANVPSAVYEYLKSVFPGHGNIQAVTCTLINQLVLALKSNGIERYDLENEQLILSVLAGRHTHHRAPRKTRSRNVGRGAEGVRRSPAKRKGKLQRPSEQDSSGGFPKGPFVIEDHGGDEA